MNKIIKYFLEILYKTETKDAAAKQIAKHLAYVYLYELKGIDSLYPDIKDKYKRLAMIMDNLGMPIKLSEAFRSAKKQDTYYRKVPKVTNARGLQSYHQYGLAFDVISKIDGWKASQKFWDTLGREGKKFGLEWGGDWKFKDVAHFEWHPDFTWEDLQSYFEK
ncbi:MAG: hypothetical protein GWP19_03325 [Planctomycetia bacterium]|nr:hypothetical protein [Planctomycetia bacterium]